MIKKFRVWDKKRNKYIINGEEGCLTNLLRCDGWDMVNIDDYVFEQSTGLKDANGYEIYEYDVVRLDDDLCNVIFDEAKFEISGSGVCYDLGEEFMNCEVIGNMHINKNNV